MRIVTRGDLDGLVSAVLLSMVEHIEGIELVHPQHITDNIFSVQADDVLVNIPYHPACAMWFDRHEITESNIRPPGAFPGAHALRPSTARVIMEHYGSDDIRKYASLVDETDRFCSADLGRADIEDPQGIVLLGFLIDPRTSFGAYKVFFKSLFERLKTIPVADLLAQPDVAERIEFYREQAQAFREALLAHSRVIENVVVTDFRDTENIPIGNRFIIYTLYPDCNVSIRLQWGPGKRFVAATLGKSILNRTCDLHIGALCSDYGGGGHEGAGSCPLEPDTADEQVEEIAGRLVLGED